MIPGVQLLGILFAAIMVYLTYVYYKRRNYGFKSFILWLAVWGGVLVLITFPTTIYGIMEALEIERTADFFVMSGFAFFSVIIFYLFVVVKKTNQKVEELVRAIAHNKKETKESNHRRRK